MEENEFSDPIDINDGYVIFQVVDKKNIEFTSSKEINAKIWQSYIKYEKSQKYSDVYQKYYYTNLDSFKVNAASVLCVQIDSSKIFVPRIYSSKELIQYYNSHLDQFTIMGETKVLNQVREEVIEQVLEEKRMKKLKEILDSLRKKNYSTKKMKDDKIDFDFRIIFLEKFKGIIH